MAPVGFSVPPQHGMKFLVGDQQKMTPELFHEFFQLGLRVGLLEAQLFLPRLHGLLSFQSLKFQSNTHGIHGIYANIWGILMGNVTIYTIHESYGIYFTQEVGPASS